jgi:hypothetical protein
MLGPVRRFAFSALGVSVAALTWAAIATTRDWPATWPKHVGLLVAAGAAWAAAVLALRALPRVRGDLAVVLLIALAVRLPAWWMSPLHSDDAYRFVWDGRVQRAGINPYLYAPDAPELASLRDELWAKVNHRQLLTIYPPGAQLAFRAAAALPLPPLAAWKVLVAAFDLGLLALLILWLRRAPGDPRAAIAWGWSPLVAIELAGNAHVDGIAACLLTAAVVGLKAEKPRSVPIWLALSAAVKPLGLALAPLVGRPLRLLVLIGALAMIALPYASAGARLSGSLGEYGRRWRANDGAFALIHAGATGLVAHTRFARMYELGSSPRLARVISGRDRDQIYPDEVANLIARGTVLLAFALAVGSTMLRGRPPLDVATVAVGSFLLLTPALHPWYVLFALPLVALGASTAWLALAALVPLGYWPLAEFHAGAGWHEPLWTRALVHGVTWTLLLASTMSRNRLTPTGAPVISDDP